MTPYCSELGSKLSVICISDFSVEVFCFVVINLSIHIVDVIHFCSQIKSITHRRRGGCVEAFCYVLRTLLELNDISEARRSDQVIQRETRIRENESHSPENDPQKKRQSHDPGSEAPPDLIEESTTADVARFHQNNSDDPQPNEGNGESVDHDEGNPNDLQVRSHCVVGVDEGLTEVIEVVLDFLNIGSSFSHCRLDAI